MAVRLHAAAEVAGVGGGLGLGLGVGAPQGVFEWSTMSFTASSGAPAGVEVEVEVEAVAIEHMRSPPAAATRQRAPSFAFNSGAGSVASGPGWAAPGCAAARRRRTLPRRR